MTTEERLETALHTLWGQAKTSPDYDKSEWTDFQAKLVRADNQMRQLQAELARYRKVVGIVQEIILEHDEHIPRGTG